MMDSGNIEAYLKKHEIKPSFQRMKVFEYLIKHRNHPTVDNIYQELVKDIPTLSKTTVYNTLNLFLEKKIVQLIVIEEHETRYDADISTHAHFKCEKCGLVYDIYLDESDIDIKGLEKFEVKEKHIYFKGRCEKCNTK